MPAIRRLCCVAAAVALVAMTTAATAAPRKLQRVRTVVLDPGHGGENLGAPSVPGIYEKELTLELALLVERHLNELCDARVELTRRDDRYVGLRERIRFANQVGASVFLSLHFNAEPGRHARGVETYFLSAEASDEEAARLVARENERLAAEEPPLVAGTDLDEARAVALMMKDMAIHAAHVDSAPLAEAVLRRLLPALGSPSRGVKQAPFAVLTEAECPAIVVEVGFLSHPAESYDLIQPETLDRAARAIALAVLDFDRARR